MFVRSLFVVMLALAAAEASAQRSPPVPSGAPPRVVAIDRVIAVVNDEAITQYELEEARRIVLQQLKQQNVQQPAADVLDKQVLERLITERALLQFAKESGIKVDDTQVERTIQRIAEDNKLTMDTLRQALARDNIVYAKYRDDVRNEIVVQRLREREVDNRITVSDAEGEHYLATVKAQSGGDAEYRLAHILVLVPEQASSAQIDAKRRRAEEALKSVSEGTDFGQAAAGLSGAGGRAPSGHPALRPGGRLPTVLRRQVRRV